MRLILLLAVIAAGAYYWHMQNPNAFGGAGSTTVNTISGDVSKVEGKARHLR